MRFCRRCCWGGSSALVVLRRFLVGDHFACVCLTVGEDQALGRRLLNAFWSINFVCCVLLHAAAASAAAAVLPCSFFSIRGAGNWRCALTNHIVLLKP